MKVYLGADHGGFQLKEMIKQDLLDNGYDITDVSETPHSDFVESTNELVLALNKDKESLAIAFDSYGVGSFIAATKHSGIIAAEISEERSAYMTREHNNSRMITLGQEIVGCQLAKNIALSFLKADYAGGRHQIRVDMLNKMC